MLSRGDVAIPLTDDHKAAREDETVSAMRKHLFLTSPIASAGCSSLQTLVAGTVCIT